MLVVLPGGSQSQKSRSNVLHGGFADDSQIAYTDKGAHPAPLLEQRLDDASQHLIQALNRRPQPIEPGLLNERLLSGRWSA